VAVLADNMEHATDSEVPTLRVWELEGGREMQYAPMGSWLSLGSVFLSNLPITTPRSSLSTESGRSDESITTVGGNEISEAIHEEVVGQSDFPEEVEGHKGVCGALVAIDKWINSYLHTLYSGSLAVFSIISIVLFNRWDRAGLESTQMYLSIDLSKKAGGFTVEAWLLTSCVLIITGSIHQLLSILLELRIFSSRGVFFSVAQIPHDTRSEILSRIFGFTPFACLSVGLLRGVLSSSDVTRRTSLCVTAAWSTYGGLIYVVYTFVMALCVVKRGGRFLRPSFFLGMTIIIGCDCILGQAHQYGQIRGDNPDYSELFSLLANILVIGIYLNILEKAWLSRKSGEGVLAILGRFIFPLILLGCMTIWSVLYTIVGFKSFVSMAPTLRIDFEPWLLYRFGVSCVFLMFLALRSSVIQHDNAEKVERALRTTEEEKQTMAVHLEIVEEQLRHVLFNDKDKGQDQPEEKRSLLEPEGEEGEDERVLDVDAEADAASSFSARSKQAYMHGGSWTARRPSPSDSLISAVEPVRLIRAAQREQVRRRLEAEAEGEAPKSDKLPSAEEKNLYGKEFILPV
jgi:hypothetical protein